MNDDAVADIEQGVAGVILSAENDGVTGLQSSVELIGLCLLLGIGFTAGGLIVVNILAFCGLDDE